MFIVYLLFYLPVIGRGKYHIKVLVCLPKKPRKKKKKKTSQIPVISGGKHHIEVLALGVEDLAEVEGTVSDNDGAVGGEVLVLVALVIRTLALRNILLVLIKCFYS